MVEFLRSISLMLMSDKMARIFGCFPFDKQLVQTGPMGVMFAIVLLSLLEEHTLITILNQPNCKGLTQLSTGVHNIM